MTPNTYGMSSSSSSSSSPTIRSRTLLFLSYRDSRTPSASFSRHPQYDDIDADENQSLIKNQFAASLPPKWVDISDQVQIILRDTHTKITALEKLHAKHVLPGFTDRSAEEREIEAITTDITKDFRQCQKLIQRIGSEQAHTFPPDSTKITRHEALAAKNVQRGLAAQVQDLSTTFRKKQRVYMEKLQGHAIKNQDLLVASGTISSRGSEGMSAVDDDVEAAQTQSSALIEDGSDYLQRDRELTEIAKSISELAELFKDLSGLVIDQGTLLDSVEYNIEQTGVQVADAVKELNTATRYQKNTGRRTCIFLLILIIFGLIVVLIFKPRRHSSPSMSPLPTSSPRETFVPIYYYRRRTFG